MLKEIHEQPRAMRDTLLGRFSLEEGAVHLEELGPAAERLREAPRVVLLACGTSWHAGLVGKFLIEQLARIPAEVDYGSEFRYRDPHLPMEGVFHNGALISIKKTYPAHAKKIIHGLWGKGQMMFAKLLVVVDDDVDVQNISYTAWRVLNNVDWKRDVVISEGPLDDLDHAASWPRYGSKMGIDATRKTREEGMTREWPDELLMSEEIRKLVDRRWKEYGLT